MDRYNRFRFTVELPAQADLYIETVILCFRYKVNGQEFWDNNSGKNYLVRVSSQLPPPTIEVSDKPKMPRCRTKFRFSERYNLATSLRTTSTLLATNESAQSEMHELRKHLSSPSKWENHKRSNLDLSSTAYKEMTQQLCFFQPEDTTKRLDDISQLISHLSSDGSAELSRTPNFHNPSV
jgi:Carbohydrate/starch-binding module (family 21)